MKKFLLLLVLLPSVLFSQYRQAPVHYDSENTAKEIINGNIDKFLSDSIDWVFEKSPKRFLTAYGRSPYWVESKVYKISFQGNMEYVSRTNGGYVFTIAVVDSNDNTEVINYITFHVDVWTQKINMVEVLLGN